MKPRLIASARIVWPAILLLAAGLRAAEVVRRPLQVNEGLELYLGGLRVPALLAFMRDHNVHPPLNPLFVWALESAHVSDALIRALFVLIATACALLLMFVVRRWSGEPAASIAGFFAACMPVLIFNDTIIRMYATFDLFALLSFYCLSVLLTDDRLRAPARRALWVVWWLTIAIALYLIYLAFFVLLAQLAYAAIVRRDALAKASIGAGAALAAWLPQLSTFLAQLPRGGEAFPGFAGGVPTLIATLPEQASLQIPYGGAFGIALVAVVWLWLIGALIATVRRRSDSLLPWVALPALITVAYSLAAHKLLYVDRYYLLFAYALCAWTGVALAGKSLVGRPDAVRAPASGRAVTIAAVACALILAAAVQHVTDPKHSTAELYGVGTLLREASAPHDLFVFEQGTPAYVLARLGVLQGHPLVLIFTPAEVRGAWRNIAGRDRVWYVGFEAWPIDRDALVLTQLQTRDRLIRYWRFSRALAAEEVLVAEFERKGANAARARTRRQGEEVRPH